MTDERYMRPGIEFSVGKLIEELGELQAALGKTLRWGFRSMDPTSSSHETNEDWILRELADVEQAVRNFKHEFMKTTPYERSKMFGYGNAKPEPTP